MASLSTFLKGCGVFAMATGTMDLLFGVRMLESGSGASFPMNSAAAVLADSQFRFLGGIWTGYGMMLWWTSNDIRTRRVPLAILGGIMGFGGIGRTISGVLHGFSSPLILGFTAIELVVPPAIWVLGNWRE